MRAGSVVAGVALLGLGTTCIIPDRDIGFAGGPENPGAVRVVVRPPTMGEMDEFCNADPDEDAFFDASFCPAAREQLRPPGLISLGPTQPFCVCPSGVDNRALSRFNVYVEDPDVERDLPKDTLYGVLLLDPALDEDRPSNRVAYENYLEPCGVGIDISATQTELPRALPSEARDDIPQRLFRVDDGSGLNTVDLCNDNNGEPLSPGLHNLQFMVTDRPFFRPVVEGPDGEDLVIDGEIQRGPQQCGVPDLAAGATYAVAEWVFECVSAADGDEAGLCDCGGGP